MLVPLTQPRWVVELTFVLLSMASLALMTSALWAGLDGWFAVPLAIFPFLVHFIERRRHPKRLRGRVLVVYPHQPWQLAFFSEVTGLTDSIEVIVSQRWHHFFGISLGLKLQNCPHNTKKTVMIVVWRQCVSASVLREVAMGATRQIDGAGRHTKGDAA